MGLLLGASIMTVFELVDLIIYNILWKSGVNKVSSQKTREKLPIRNSHFADMQDIKSLPPKTPPPKLAFT